jgi:hypothetical protein
LFKRVQALIASPQAAHPFEVRLPIADAAALLALARDRNRLGDALERVPTPPAMARPIRVQLSRAKGWRKPPNTVSVARPTIWGNPWRILYPNEFRRLWFVDGPAQTVECASEAEAVALALRKFRYYASSRPELIAPLRGRNLACWCALDAPCHADVLLELANAPAEVRP